MYHFYMQANIQIPFVYFKRFKRFVTYLLTITCF